MKADGVCDDINNNEHCQYDGGDCCGHFENVIRRYCFNCTCISNQFRIHSDYIEEAFLSH